jgi:hypothetical protein
MSDHQASAPIDATVAQYLMPFRMKDGTLELLLQHAGRGKSELHLIAASPSYAIWEQVNREQNLAPDLVLRGAITDTLSILLKHSEHRIVGTTEPFLYLMADARNDYPTLAIGYVIDYCLDEPPDGFFWAPFSDVCRGESTVFPIRGPSADPEPFAKMLKEGQEIFDRYWLLRKQREVFQDAAKRQ